MSLLNMIHEANTIVTSKYPGATCIQVSGLGALETIPYDYRFTFGASSSMEGYSIDGHEDKNSGKITFSGITVGKKILGVTGDLMTCTVDIYPAMKNIRTAGYEDPIFFCGLFQAVVPGITQPWYCFTPNNCVPSTSDNYIFVNAITGQVKLFPKDQQYK